MSTVSVSAGLAGVRPENELLQCCARTRMDSRRAERVRELLRGEVNWVRLIAAASRHGLRPLLYWQLQATCPELVPPMWLGCLHDYFLQLARRNLFLAAELFKILERFEAEGIPAVAVKGPALAVLVYGHLAQREFLDLDILLQDTDVPRAHDLLVSLGYRPRFDPRKVQAAGRLRAAGQFLFEREDGEGLVELHSEMTLRHFPVPLDVAAVTKRLEPVAIGGKRIPTLGPEDLLIFLCVHGAKDFWEQLKWVCDISEIVGGVETLDWEQVLGRARKLRCERMLFLGLYLASDLLQAPLPERVAQRVQAEPAVGLLAARVRRKIFQEADFSWRVWEHWKFRFEMRERAMDGARYCFRLATTPTEDDYVAVPLPAPLFPLYSLVRPLRLAWALGAGLFPNRTNLAPDGFDHMPQSRMDLGPQENQATRPLRQDSDGQPAPLLLPRHSGQMKAISFARRVVPASDVLVRSVDGESVLLHLKKERYFGLDKVGTGMWAVLMESDSIEAAYHALLSEYDVEPERLRQDLETFVAGLLEQGLVEIGSE